VSDLLRPEEIKKTDPTIAELVMEMYQHSLRSDRHYETAEMSISYRPFVYTTEPRWKKIMRLVKLIK
jgi:hypothetical protein